MAEPKSLRPIAAPFVAAWPTGVAIRARLKGLTIEDEGVLRQVTDPTMRAGAPVMKRVVGFRVEAASPDGSRRRRSGLAGPR